MLKKLGFLAAATLVSFSAYAEPVEVTYCDTLTTLQEMDAAFADPGELGGVSEGISHCVQGDKSYEYWGAVGLAPDTEVEFPDPTGGKHIFLQKNLSNLPDNYGALAYAIEVLPSSPNYISRVDLTMSVLEGPGLEYQINKYLFSYIPGCDFSVDFCFEQFGQLSVFWSDEDSQLSDYLDVAVTKLFVVEEFIAIGDGATIYVASNEFTQTPVPAPASLALLGAGLLGLGAMRRRKVA